MALFVVEEREGLASPKKLVDWFHAEDERQALFTVGGVAAYEKKWAGGDEGKDLVVLERESGLANVGAEIPFGIPVGECQADSAFAAHGDFDSRIEGSKEKRFFSA